MEAIAGFLTLAGSVAFWVSFISILWPLAPIGLPTRKRSALAMLLSCVVVVIGVSLSRETPEVATERAEREDVQEERQRAEQETARQAELVRTIEVSAPELVREFEANEIRAEQKYTGKIVRVTGAVDNIGEDIMGDGYVSFRGSGLLRNAQAMIDDKSALAPLNPGQRITVTCHDVSGGNIMGVLLRNCALD